MTGPRRAGGRKPLLRYLAVLAWCAGSVSHAEAVGYLAAAPIEGLTATRDHPLFVPGRRPATTPAPIDVGSRASPPPPSPADQDPGLTLLGIVGSPAGSAAVVEDKTDHTSFSLRLGDGRRGWIVRSIGAGSVVLRKDQAAATLTYPRQGRPGTNALSGAQIDE